MKWTLEKRAELVALRRTICEEVAKGGKPFQPTVEKIASRFHGEKGLSVKNIRKLFDRWMNSGKSDAALDPYVGIIVDKRRILVKHDLTRAEVRRWFKAKGITLTKWAIGRGFGVSAVGKAVAGQRVGKMSEEIMDRLATEIRGTPAALLERRAELQAQISSLGKELDRIEQRILKATTSDMAT
jgi:gp16 family phage-associated protein